jgi:hypothetical protein
MAAKGLVPLPPEELIPLQIELARKGDEEIVDTARQALKELEPHESWAVMPERDEKNPGLRILLGPGPLLRR